MSSLTKRNYGVDLLRIVATLMICMLHTLGRGGILSNAEFMSVNYEIAWFLETACLCAVNCYGLISGYVGGKSKYRYSSYVTLWLNVFIVMLFFTVYYAITMPETVTWTDWVKLFFPASTRQFWYFSSYTVLFLFMPVLNIAVQKLSKKQLGAMLIAILIFFTVLNTAFYNPDFEDAIWQAKNEPFGLLDGYSGLWLIVLYLIGAYFGKYGLPKKITAVKGILIYFGSVIIAWAVRYLIDKFADPNVNRAGYFYLASYLSPFMLTAAFGLLCAFVKLPISGGFAKVIAFVAPCTFAIYLIQCQPLVWVNFMNELVKDYANVSPFKLIGIVFGVAVCIFLVGLILDKPREIIFRKTKLSKNLSAFEEKHFGDIWKQNIDKTSQL